jgi:hypothetical protein
MGTAGMTGLTVILIHVCMYQAVICAVMYCVHVTVTVTVCVLCSVRRPGMAVLAWQSWHGSPGMAVLAWQSWHASPAHQLVLLVCCAVRYQSARTAMPVLLINWFCWYAVL